MRTYSLRSVFVAAAVMAGGVSSVVAQPLFLQSQNRTLSVSGMCCGEPARSESAAETGVEANFDRSIGVGEEVDPYNFYSAFASQTTTISQNSIFGHTQSSASSRGLSFPASSDASVSCDVVFEVRVRCRYTFTVANEGQALFFWPTTFSLGSAAPTPPPPPPPLFSGQVDADEPSYSRSGTLSAGVYRFTLGSTVFGQQLGSVARSVFTFTLTPECACDWTGDTTLDSADVFAFLADFFTGEADFDGSGQTNSQDFFGFLQCFFGACE